MGACWPSAIRRCIIKLLKFWVAENQTSYRYKFSALLDR
jgi:hypothetical protein